LLLAFLNLLLPFSWMQLIYSPTVETVALYYVGLAVLYVWMQKNIKIEQRKYIDQLV